MKLIAQVMMASCLGLAALGVSAQNIQLLPEGQTLISLSVTEKRTVDQDTLTAVLRIESVNTDAQTLQREINAAMAQALERSESVDTVEVSTGYYSVYQFNNAPIVKCISHYATDIKFRVRILMGVPIYTCILDITDK